MTTFPDPHGQLLPNVPSVAAYFPFRILLEFNFEDIILTKFLYLIFRLLPWNYEKSSKKLGKVSWICVYAARKDVSEKFKHIQNCYNMTTLLMIKHTFMPSAIGSNFFKTYFCSVWDSGSPKTRQATHSPKCHCQKSLDLTSAYQINKLLQLHL